MPSFSPSQTLKPSQFSPICPVWCNGQKYMQSAQAATAFWVRDCSFCYHMSTLLTKRFWHPVFGRMLAQILKQVGSSQTSHWITQSRDNNKKKKITVEHYEGWPFLDFFRAVNNIDESFARCTSVYFYADSSFFSVIFLNVRSRECRAVLTGHQIMQTALTVESAEWR